MRLPKHYYEVTVPPVNEHGITNAKVEYIYESTITRRVEHTWLFSASSQEDAEERARAHIEMHKAQELAKQRAEQEREAQTRRFTVRAAT